MTLETRRQKIIEVINNLFDEQERAETMADLVEKGLKDKYHIVKSEDYLRGLASGYQRSAMRLMKLKKEIELEIGERDKR